MFMALIWIRNNSELCPQLPLAYITCQRLSSTSAKHGYLFIHLTHHTLNLITQAAQVDTIVSNTGNP